MTACFKLMKALQQHSRPHSDTHCTSCVYFSKNLDEKEYPVLMETAASCGLGFLAGDGGCTEMRTDNCSARKHAG